jgi:hypothetical protein
MKYPYVLCVQYELKEKTPGPDFFGRGLLFEIIEKGLELKAKT